MCVLLKRLVRNGLTRLLYVCKQYDVRDAPSVSAVADCVRPFFMQRDRRNWWTRRVSSQIVAKRTGRMT